MSTQAERPRLTVDLDLEVKRAIEARLPRGVRNEFFQSIIRKVVDQIGKDPELVKDVLVGDYQLSLKGPTDEH